MVSNTYILLLMNTKFDLIALCVWSLHDYTNRKKPLTVIPQMKSKKTLVPLSLLIRTTSPSLEFSTTTSNEKLLFFCLHNSCMPFNKVVWPFPCEWVNLNVTISVSFDTKVISFVHKTRRQLLD